MMTHSQFRRFAAGLVMVLAILLLSGFSNREPKAIQMSNFLSGKLQGLDVGSKILFGSYEQDNRTSNGKESIEWIVLDTEGDDLLLISKYSLDVQCYDGQSAIWADCFLRSWLNDTFLREAFSAEEQKAIVSTTLFNWDNSESAMAAGRNTTDKVFALSIEEAQKYFQSDRERAAMPTEYAIGMGAVVDDALRQYKTDGEPGTGNSCWWLRSPGEMSNCAAFVNMQGRIVADGTDVWRVGRGIGPVRPAMWVNTNYLPG